MTVKRKRWELKDLRMTMKRKQPRLSFDAICPMCVPQAFVLAFVQAGLQPESFQTIRELEELGTAREKRTPLTQIAEAVYGRVRSRSGDKRQRDREGSRLSMYARYKIKTWEDRLGLKLCDGHKIEPISPVAGSETQHSKRRKRPANKPTAYEIALQNTPAPATHSEDEGYDRARRLLRGGLDYGLSLPVLRTALEDLERECDEGNPPRP